MLKRLGMCALAIAICTMIYIGCGTIGNRFGADERKIRGTKILPVTGEPLTVSAPSSLPLTKAKGLIGGGGEDIERDRITKIHAFLAELAQRLTQMNKNQLSCQSGAHIPGGEVIVTMLNPDYHESITTQTKGAYTTGAMGGGKKLFGGAAEHCKFYFIPVEGITTTSSGGMTKAETIESILKTIDNIIRNAKGVLHTVSGGTQEAVGLKASGNWLVYVKGLKPGGDLFVVEDALTLEPTFHTMGTYSTPVQPASQRSMPVINRMR